MRKAKLDFLKILFVLGFPKNRTENMFLCFNAIPKTPVATTKVIVLSGHIVLISIARSFYLIYFFNVLRKVFLSAGTPTSINTHVLSTTFLKIILDISAGCLHTEISKACGILLIIIAM